jgi:hypothetical protein
VGHAHTMAVLKSGYNGADGSECFKVSANISPHFCIAMSPKTIVGRHT